MREIRAQGRAFTAILRGPYAGRVLLLGVIWMLIYACTQNAITFWKEFAVAERSFSDAEVGRSIAIAAVAAMPLVFGVGTLLDAVGRRRGAVLVFGVTALGVFGSYTLHDPWALTAYLALGAFGATGVLPVLASFNAELPPTALRGDAYGWANNGIGRIGHVLSPVLVGMAAESFDTRRAMILEGGGGAVERRPANGGAHEGRLRGAAVRPPPAWRPQSPKSQDSPFL